MTAAQNNRNSEDHAAAFRETKDRLNDLRYELGNHETEIRMLSEKCTNVESAIESLRDQLTTSVLAHKDSQKGSISLDAKISHVENLARALTSDLKQVRTVLEDHSTTLSKWKKKLDEFEHSSEKQSQNIAHMQNALKSLMEALEIKAPDLTPSTKAYRVASGDTLEKIARKHKTTIKSLRELNDLKNDRINVGQTLQIPDVTG